jgi:hypothetical protein
MNETFVMKMIHLPPGQKVSSDAFTSHMFPRCGPDSHTNPQVKIGRQTNAKTVPGERNGYFDSKVLSRMHADVWEENGKVCDPYLLASPVLQNTPLI